MSRCHNRTLRGQDMRPTFLAVALSVWYGLCCRQLAAAACYSGLLALYRFDTPNNPGFDSCGRVHLASSDPSASLLAPASTGRSYASVFNNINSYAFLWSNDTLPNWPTVSSCCVLERARIGPVLSVSRTTSSSRFYSRRRSGTRALATARSCRGASSPARRWPARRRGVLLLALR